MDSYLKNNIANLSLGYKVLLALPEGSQSVRDQRKAMIRSIQCIMICQRSVFAGAFINRDRTGEEDWRFQALVEFRQAA